MTDFAAVATLPELASVLSDGLPDYFEAISYNAATDVNVGRVSCLRAGITAHLFNHTSVWTYTLVDASGTLIGTFSWDDLPTDTASLNSVTSRAATDLVAQIDALSTS